MTVGVAATLDVHRNGVGRRREPVRFVDMDGLHDLTALELGALVRNGETSPLGLAEHYLDRVERLDDVGAFVHRTAEQARERAAALGAVGQSKCSKGS